jgi:2-oxoglutarate dehydrogenase E2 component (dihydrolipoamide succinyltransferase)
MAQFEILMPKLGESIEEATVIKWFVKVGDKVEDDDVLLEIATDKVDSEIPSPVSGTLIKINVEQDQTVLVGTVIGVIDLDGGSIPDETDDNEEKTAETKKEPESETISESATEPELKTDTESVAVSESKTSETGRFYSPLVLTMARKEGIALKELEGILGSGRNGRVQKKDMLDYIAQRKAIPEKDTSISSVSTKVSQSLGAGDEILEMDRMRKLIAEHMIRSKQTSAHVTNMLEADVTDIVLWRNRIKEDFHSREGEKITYLPVFLEAILKSLRDFPMLNSSVDGDRIIIKKDLNLGIAVALPSGNLIVPVIKNADSLNLLGLTKALNKMADDARNSKLNPDDISGGTFTISNFGTFRNVMGTPIINQPQVAILAIGTVEKKPAVIETTTGDVIGIRHKMFLSLTYDHRIIDGAYGGAFLRKLGEYLESFDGSRSI